MNESNSSTTDITQPLSLQVQDIHTSWIREMPNGELIEKLRETPSSRASLSKFIKQYLPSNEIDDEDEITKQLLQHKPEDLHQLVLKAGATQFSSKIRLIITKKAVISLKKSLGEDLYNFSLNEAPELSNELESSVAQTFMEGIDPLSQVINNGYKSLRLALDDSPNNCIYKLPKEWNESYSSSESIDPKTKSDSGFHKTLISRLINGETTNVDQLF